MKRWTPDEINWLKSIAPHYTAKELSEITGRSLSSVTSKMSVLGVSPAKVYRPWTSGEARMVDELLKLGFSSEKIGRQVGHPGPSVRSFLRNRKGVTK